MHRTIAVLALLLLAAAVLVLWPGSDHDGSGDALERTPEEAAANDVRTAGTEVGVEGAEPSLTGTAEAAPETPRGTRVRVRTRSGLPVRGMTVVAAPGANARSRVYLTDDEGRARLPNAAHDGSLMLWLTPTGLMPRRRPPPVAVVTGPVTEIVTDWGIPLSIRCVDAVDGRELPEAEATSQLGDLAALRVGKRDSLTLEIRVPAGHVAWEERHFRTTVGCWTKAVEVVYPVHREARVLVTLRDHLGAPAEATRIDSFEVGARRIRIVRSETVRDGTLRLYGVPWFRRGLLEVIASRRATDDTLYKRARLADHPTGETQLTFSFPDPRRERDDDGLIGLGGGSGGRFGDGQRRGPRGTVEVRVVRHDGSPAVGARVEVAGRSAIANAHGMATITGVPVGEHTVETDAPGLLPASAKILVAPDGTASVRLVESGGGGLAIHVVDGENRALPFARIDLKTPSGQPWVDEVDGVQRIDPFTDENGRRRIERVETGRVEVRARWAERFAKVHVEVVEGSLAEARIVLAEDE